MACRPMTLLMLSSPWEGSTAQPCEGPPASAEPTTPGARPARKEVSYGHASDHSGSAVQPSGGRCHRVRRDLPGASATSRTKNSRPYSCSLSRPPRSSHLAGEPAPATQPTGSEPSRGGTQQRASRVVPALYTADQLPAVPAFTPAPYAVARSRLLNAARPASAAITAKPVSQAMTPQRSPVAGTGPRWVRIAVSRSQRGRPGERRPPF